MAESLTSRSVSPAGDALTAAIDESPIVRRSFTVGEIRCVAAPPLRFDVVFDRDASVHELSGEFDIVLSAPTRAELEEMLAETLELLWREYAEEDPAILSPKAADLRTQLRARSRTISTKPSFSRPT